jgi:hypothetical protein
VKEVKVLLLSLSATSILGFWMIFARQARLESQAADSMEAAATQQTTNTFLSSLPPLPTLVPPPNQAALSGADPMVVLPGAAPVGVATPVVAVPWVSIKSQIERPDRQKGAGVDKAAAEPAAQTRSS